MSGNYSNRPQGKAVGWVNRWADGPVSRAQPNPLHENPQPSTQPNESKDTALFAGQHWETQPLFFRRLLPESSNIIPPTRWAASGQFGISRMGRVIWSRLSPALFEVAHCEVDSPKIVSQAVFSYSTGAFRVRVRVPFD